VHGHLHHVATPTRSAVILDSQLLWLEAVECVLSRADVEVVGKATTAEEALSLLAEVRADVFVIGVSAGDRDFDGLRCLQLAQEVAPGVQCVVLSTASDPEQIHAVLEAGAVAYVFKSAHPDDLTSAVRQVFDHSVYLAQASVALPLRKVNNDKVAHNDKVAPEVDELTNREREILRLMSEGHSNAQLASMLWITEQTVKFHLSNVYRKLNVANRTEAARWAQLQGLLPPIREAV
jgi:DNA-binding NarL/FixJ family response regulator